MSGHYKLTVRIETKNEDDTLGPFTLAQSDDFESLADMAVTLRDFMETTVKTLTLGDDDR